jgi:hypothetical protein
MAKRRGTTEQAYVDGRKAADARLPGNAPYEPNDAPNRFPETPEVRP